MQKIKLLAFLLAVVALVVYPAKLEAVQSVPILMYHYVGNNPNPKDLVRNTLSVTPSKFEAEMNYLSQAGFTPISLDTLYAIQSGHAASPARPIVLTFDDGYIDFYTTAFPILKRFNFHAVSFIPTGLMGAGYYMSWNQIKEIQSSGLITFEDHTITHANLAALNYNQAFKEISDSKNILQSHTGYPVNFIAYPFGAANPQAEVAAKNAGLLGGLGTWYGKALNISMNMPRIRITGQMDLKTFESLI